MGIFAVKLRFLYAAHTLPWAQGFDPYIISFILYHFLICDHDSAQAAVHALRGGVDSNTCSGITHETARKSFYKRAGANYNSIWKRSCLYADCDIVLCVAKGIWMDSRRECYEDKK